MPLYMDFHKIPSITIDEARKAHEADEKIQQKYGVKYLQFWVNEVAETLFCLVEGPDKTTCESVHQMAHGHLACAMVEVDPSYYALIMGENIRIDRGVVKDEGGGVDTGYRSILAIRLAKKRIAKSSAEHLMIPEHGREIVSKKVAEFHGRPVQLAGDDSLTFVFNSSLQAELCAVAVQHALLQFNKKQKSASQKILFSIGAAAGEPVSINNEFIAVTIRIARRLCLLAGDTRILRSSLMQELNVDYGRKNDKKLKSMGGMDESFMTSLFENIENNISDEDFKIDALSQAMGVSRPQLYRKIQALTGKAPNDLIRDVRLEKALSLLKRKSGNIAEIAFEVGFGNPSYFAKCFSEKFGCSPSRVTALQD